MAALSVSSGITAKITKTDEPIEVIAAQPGGIVAVTIYNEGIASGFFSIDAGSTWHRLSGGNSISKDNINTKLAIQVKRIAGGTNLSGIYASADTL